MINLNGTVLETENATVALNNRGLNYGDAVFETLRFSGGKIYFWEDHYFRLMASMRILRMEIPMNFTMEFLEEEIIRIVNSEEKNNPFRIKLLVWRKTGGKYAPLTNDIEYAISLEKLEEPFYNLDESNCEIELFKDHYITSGLLSTLKTTNRLINILGSIYAQENQYDNCLLLNENKQIVEALNGNVFLVTGNIIKTPPLSDGCLNGIMRKQIIAIIKELPKIEIEESSVSPFELQKGDEIFITNTIQGLVPVTKYRKKEFNNTVAKTLLPKLNLRARMA
ncbi:aminotransferase class IV [Aequorivita vladivostokensis]|uniref:branched-chain-amino-acid transaminase n=1 Tax=Aequorivita vladivostokensis TaxID=171194 RepID=A0ABR5DLF2_9FLAO|nr:aminotransferase class IV [Aequorivita vladivostokensis]KJJ39605.1 aminotransferase class IV [Aequorivita vladivostokensis]MAO47945.1 aminotransferase class IV [Aequorivita sp.]HAV55846.1 aminotransferase class IV [Aequorivita sp.]|tara:strand:- start:7545 stop:8387 length:843 start_codon:yes stop_codon:yes gene_type:complete